MVEDEIGYLGQRAREMLAEYRAAAGASRKPVSFADIERIWVESIEPKLGHFESMKEFFDGQSEPPAPDSQWRLNWAIPRFWRR
jgi:hypothetical protein